MYEFPSLGCALVGRRSVPRFFCRNIDDITDDIVEAELSSIRGKHPKWISLMHNENFRLEATQYIREHGYVKGAPNLTLAHWVAGKWDVEVCEETARLWLHDMGFTYRQFSKGFFFDGPMKGLIGIGIKCGLIMEYPHDRWQY